ncbi:SDR family NAD(P)-dependent oxidoreductase [Lysinibacillus sp. NPDC058147]|uniref:SDR family NAD(P)-dependent oxidoreductase n=1 Tax=unclassified Lysinibacillus TaxID=2636778 RepID=UPI0036DD84B3
MQKLLRIILENTQAGNIDKQTAAKMLHTLQNEILATSIQEDIAIVGIAGELPVCNSIDEYWEGINNSIDFIGDFPETRRQDIDKYINYSGLEDLDEVKYLQGAYINEIDKFDYRLFRLSPNEASLMDPYQRLFLQVAYKAIEDGGYNKSSIAGTRTGVFVGYASNAKDSYQKMIYDTDVSLMAAAAVGNVTAMIPSRISYLLDLKGPSMVIDTACSSSLVSVHLACEAIKNQDCDMAIAGGIRMSLLPLDKEYMKFGIESTDGRTRSFDDQSDGSGMGEGVVAVLLKPLRKAKRDRDNIYAVIKGSAINQDGTSIGITAPNPDSQMDVILKAWEKAEINPETLSYIEAHGTGTALGDPIEIDGLIKAFRNHTDKHQFCAIGTVKSNVGHLYESAGLVGLLKCIMMLKNKTIPPSINFNKPNSKIDFSQSPLYVNSRNREWLAGDSARRCGLSSFGFSGTNCHLVLEEAPELPRVGENSKVHLFLISAQSKHQLIELIDNYLQFLEKPHNVEIGDVCYTANVGRNHQSYRCAIVIDTLEELKEKLKIIRDGLNLINDLSGQSIYVNEHRVVPQNKMNRTKVEITERERLELGKQSATIIQNFISSDREDRKSLTELAELYSRGAEVQWDKLYRDEAVRKISAPGYPYERNRCWFEVPEGKQLTRNTDKPDKFFTIGWAVEKLPEEKKQVMDGTIMVFKGESELCQEMLNELSASPCDVITVEKGPSFKQINPNEYIISGSEVDYLHLVRNVKDRQITRIIHMMTIQDGRSIRSITDLEESQQNGVLSLFYLTKAFAKMEITNEIDILLISDYTTQVNGFEERIKPENITLLGIGKVVRKEHQNLLCRCIDVDDSTTATEIIDEINANTEWMNVAYRRGVRYVEEFKEIELDLEPSKPLEIRENGVYVITGGASGIGLEVSKYLASTEQVSLVLINKTPLPERTEWERILEQGQDQNTITRIKGIHEIEALGAEVTYYSADIGNMDEVSRVLDKVRQQYGQINGVIHGAGVGGAEPIVTRTDERFNQVFSPKVYGTWILDKLTETDQLDFFIMFSSVASLFSAPGQGDYIAANAYLDAYSYYRNMFNKRTVAVNWSTWKETGMSIKHDFNIDTLFKALMTKEGIHGLDQLINKDVPRALIGEINYESSLISLLERFMFKLSPKIRKTLYCYIGQTKVKAKPKVAGFIEEVKLSGKESDQYSAIEQKIGQIWGEVLGFDEINIYDNFFELGGDSISGLKIANLINQELGKQIGVADLLSFVTVADFVEFMEQHTDEFTNTSTSCYVDIEPCEPMDGYPASSAQTRLFIINEMEGSNINYNIYRAVTIEGPFDTTKFEYTFNEIIKRQASLRTSFKLADGKVMQYIKDNVIFNVEYKKTIEEVLDEQINAFIRPFELSQAPLLRIGLFELAKEKHVMVFDMHHMIADGISIDILIEEFLAIYEENKLEELKIQYKDYAVHQERIAESDKMLEQKKYWLELLAGDLPVLNLPTDYPRPDIKNFEGHTVSVILDKEKSQHMYRFAKESNTTPYMVMLSAFYVLLYKYTAQDDIIIGTPIAGRPSADLEKIVGMFVNTLVIRNRPKWDKTVKDFLFEVKNNVLDAFDNQDCNIEELISQLKVERSLSRNPLFDVMFVLQNVGNSEIKMNDLTISSYPIEEKISKFDLTLEVIEAGDFVDIHLNYSTKLYRNETAQRILEDYIDLLEKICFELDTPIGDLLLKSEANMEEQDDQEDREEVKFNF